jgi:hypothetical protein
LGAEREQVLLEADERPVQIGADASRTREPEPGVELVDLAVRIHAAVGLRDARAVKERRLAGVACSGVDFHDRRSGYDNRRTR